MDDQQQPDQPAGGETQCGHPLANGLHTCQRPRGHEGIHYPRSPASERASRESHERRSDPDIDLGEHWIETTSHRERSTTNWLIKRGTEIIKVGEVRDDPTGNRAFDAASEWAATNLPGTDFNWKHASGIKNHDGG